MLRREANPLFGRALGSLLGTTAFDAGTEALITLWPNRWQSGVGEELQTTWEEFLEVLTERRPWRGPHEHPGWSPATFSPMLRAPGNVRSVGAVVGRARRGASSFDAVAAALSDLRGVLYSTVEHREAAHDFLITIPLARPASVSEHARAVRLVAERLAAGSETKGALIERQPASFCYLPSWRPGQPWKVTRLTGRFIDPDALAPRVQAVSRQR